jgi:hypothetical protein
VRPQARCSREIAGRSTCGRMGARGVGGRASGVMWYQDAAAAYNVLDNSRARSPGCEKSILMGMAKLLDFIENQGSGESNRELAVSGSAPAEEEAAAKTARGRGERKPGRKRCTESQKQRATRSSNCQMKVSSNMASKRVATKRAGQ